MPNRSTDLIKILQKKFYLPFSFNLQSTSFINITIFNQQTKAMQSKNPHREEKLKAFLSKHKKHLSNQVKSFWNEQIQQFNLKPIHSTIISDSSQQDLKQAAKRLQQGGLVAFPTQTVYGLGANALNEKALLQIYQTKRRPLSDPIIVHILQPSETFKYVEISEDQRKYFQILTKAFWPGPLTVILKANLNVLPMVVTAQTGFVGIRCPNHTYFRKLLKQSNLSIGAPSANLFSHVSPTQAVHVFNDFYKDDVWVVDGGKCEYGIESTVLKILDNQIKIFRQGSLSLNKIRQLLYRQLGENASKVQVIKKTTSHEENTEAPGQMLKHYSPHIPCEYIQGPFQLQKTSKQELEKIGLISFDHGRYQNLSYNLGAYFQVGKMLDLAPNQQTEEEEKFCSYEQKIKMRQIYFLLREAENLPLSKIVVGWSGPKQGTIWDKIFRATEGKLFRS